MRLALPEDVLPGGRLDDWAPAPPRYVVADVDGTTVGPHRHATEVVVGAVRDAQAAGIAVGFATGRMRLAVQPLWEQLRARGPHVLHNGAEVRAEGRTIASWPLAPGDLDAVLTIARERDLYAEVYVEDGYLVTSRPAAARPHWELLGHDPLGEVRSSADVPGPVLKVTFALFAGGADELVAALEAAGLAAGAAGSPLTPGIWYVNATDRRADKGRALTAAAAHLDVPLDAVVAVGDDHNDRSMFAVAGTAVAMGQAPADVRAAAHLVVPEVDADGLAHALRAAIGWRRGAPGPHGR